MDFNRPDPAKLDELLALLERDASIEVLKPYLNTAKELNRSIRKSGTKAELLQQLREAVNLRLVSFDELCQLLQDIEESGRQVVYLYRPMTEFAVAKCNDGECIASALFGADWRKSLNLPAFHLTPEGTHWADFRLGPIGSKFSSWMVKIYAGLHRWTTVKREVSPDGKDEYIHRHRTLEREVYIVKWRNGLLEIRVPHADSKVQRQESIDGVWNMLDTALRQGEDLVVLDLEKARIKINEIASTPEGKKQFSLPALKLDDPDLGGGDLWAVSDEENLLDREDIRLLVPRYGGCKQSSPTWHLSEDVSGEAISLPTNIGGFGSNTIYFKEQSSPKVVHHVIDQLRGLS